MFLDGDAVPAYHERMLIVRLRETPDVTAMSFRSMEDGGGGGEAPQSSGLAMLAYLERGGLVRRVTPLASAASAASAAPAAAQATDSVGMLAAATTAGDAHLAGTSVVELDRDADVRPLQQALVADQNVEFAAQVPVRALMAGGVAGNPDLASLMQRLAALEALLARRQGRPLPPAAANAASRMWNLRRIEWDVAAARGIDMGRSVRVGVLDSGVDQDHPDLAGRIERYTFAHPDIPGRSSDQDVIGHGTHVAGTIAAAYDAPVGINGICSPRLSVWKIFDDKPDYIPGGNIFSYLVDPVMYRRALAECVDRTDVINLSIGGRQPPDPQEQLLYQTLQARGTTVVVAMGNERMAGSPTSYPAAINGVVAVGATSLDDSVGNFSNAGNAIALSAPGVAIWSTLPRYAGQAIFPALRSANGTPTPGLPRLRETGFGAQSGTSMAAPHVTGAVALYLANTTSSRAPADVRSALMASADAVPAMAGRAWTPDHGAGRLNVRRLLA